MPEADAIFKKYRETTDEAGDAGWAARVHRRAVWVPNEGLNQSQLAKLELNKKEKVIIELLKLPRRYTDVETCGVLPLKEMRCYLRALHAAEVLETQDLEKAKALVPIEVKRAAERLSGKKSSKPKKRKPIKLRGQVYRPSVEGVPDQSAPPTPTPSLSTEAAEPVQQQNDTKAKQGTSGPEDLAFAQEIDKAYKALKTADHFEVMDIARDATVEEIKKAYRDMARKYHPDTLAGRTFADPAKIGGQIEQLFSRISEAHQVLLNQDKRREYLAQLESGALENDNSGGKLRRTREAQLQYKKGLVYLQKKDFGQAHKMFRMAKDLDHGDPLFPTYMSWTTYLDPQQPKAAREKTAQTELEKILDTSPNAQAAYFLGVLMKQTGQESKARDHFERAVGLDSSHRDAIREVRLFEMRDQKVQESRRNAPAQNPGLLDRLLKK